MRIAAPTRSPSNASDRSWNCPQDCPCDAPRPRLQGQHQSSRVFGELKETEGFTRKIEDVREPDFRLANHRLQPLGDLTAARKPNITTSRVTRPPTVPSVVPEIVPG